MTTSKKINRREFLGSAAAASVAFTVVPRHVLGGPGYVAPSDKLTLGYIGCGTQGLREMTELSKIRHYRSWLSVIPINSQQIMSTGL